MTTSTNTSKPAYVSVASNSGTVNLSDYDQGNGVFYNAGAGDQVINADNNYNAINLGSGNDKVHLGSGDSVVTFGTGTSQIQCGGGHNTFMFSASTITHAGSTLDNIIDFDGAGNHSGVDPSKDFIQFGGFTAGSTVQFSGYAFPNDQQHQYYSVVGADGTNQGTFFVAMKLDADGTYHHLSALTDYRIGSSSGPSTVSA